MKEFFEWILKIIESTIAVTHRINHQESEKEKERERERERERTFIDGEKMLSERSETVH